MTFRIRQSAHMVKLMDPYCSHRGVQRTSVRFVDVDTDITPHDTPEALAMQDGDVIDVRSM